MKEILFLEISCSLSNEQLILDKGDSTNSYSHKKSKKVFKIVKILKAKKKLKNTEGKKNKIKSKILSLVSKKIKKNSSDDIEVDQSMNSLISISKKVYEFIKSKEKVNGQCV